MKIKIEKENRETQEIVIKSMVVSLSPETSLYIFVNENNELVIQKQQFGKEIIIIPSSSNQLRIK